MTVALFQQDSRLDAFSFNSGSTVTFNVVTRTSPQQNDRIHLTEHTADKAYEHIDKQRATATSENPQIASIDPNVLRAAGLASKGVILG